MTLPMRECPTCEGIGEVPEARNPGSDLPAHMADLDYVPCTRCDGSGEVVDEDRLCWHCGDAEGVSRTDVHPEFTCDSCDLSPRDQELLSLSSPDTAPVIVDRDAAIGVARDYAERLGAEIAVLDVSAGGRPRYQIRLATAVASPRGGR